MDGWRFHRPGTPLHLHTPLTSCLLLFFFFCSGGVFLPSSPLLRRQQTDRRLCEQELYLAHGWLWPWLLFLPHSIPHFDQGLFIALWWRAVVGSPIRTRALQASVGYIDTCTLRTLPHVVTRYARLVMVMVVVHKNDMGGFVTLCTLDSPPACLPDYIHVPPRAACFHSFKQAGGNGQRLHGEPRGECRSHPAQSWRETDSGFFLGRGGRERAGDH